MQETAALVDLATIKLIGISTRTANVEGRAVKDIPLLWQQFYAEELVNKVPDEIKESKQIYAVYTDYESNYKGEYTCFIGVPVDSLDEIPDGMEGRIFKAASFLLYDVEGEMPQAVVKQWQEIWDKDQQLNRTYKADYEVYDTTGKEGVKIYIGVK